MNNENENQQTEKVREENSNIAIFKDNTPSLAPSVDDFSSISGAVAQLDNMNKLAEVYVKGNLSPIKNASDFVIAVITGNQLGLPFTVSINTIFPINGKPAMSVHLVRALLLKAGITFEKVKDYVSVYTFYETVIKDGVKTVVKDSNGNPIARGVAPYADIDSNLFVIGTKPADYVTEYEFSRMIKQIDGSYKTISARASFSFVDAIKAELSEKDNWKKYPSAMTDARAFMKGAREVASDVIFGLYSIDELADANNVPYSMDNSYQQTIDAEVLN